MLYKTFFKTFFLLCFCVPLAIAASEKPPNVVLIFADDMGYGDLSSFGSEKINTPNLDRMAAEGRKFTNFMVASPVCTPSRAGLLTGTYPKRISMHNHVLFPSSTKGLNPKELTMGKYFQGAGYATACFGKWHLGHYPEVLPLSHGFDQYLGIPYSNDMSHPDNKGKPKRDLDADWVNQAEASKSWNTPLVRGNEMIELPVDQRFITQRYTDAAVEFMEENKDGSFFIYLPHSMPHIPLFVPDEVAGSDPLQAYTKVIEHMDAEVGKILRKAEAIDHQTLVIFTSDNGPWLKFKNHGGSAGPLRGGKGTTFEGGQRVPCVMWGPGIIEPGIESEALITSIDLLPSLAALVGAELSLDNKIDGMDLSKSIFANDTKGRDNFLYYSSYGDIEGIREGDWKLLHTFENSNARGHQAAVDAGEKKSIMLFNLKTDIGETDNRADDFPEKVEAMIEKMNALDRQIKQEQRPAWETEKPHPWPDTL